MTERLLDDDPRVLGETRVREPADDRAEQRRRDLEVEDRAVAYRSIAFATSAYVAGSVKSPWR